jgi:hypothetical protein
VNSVDYYYELIGFEGNGWMTVFTGTDVLGVTLSGISTYPDIVARPANFILPADTRASRALPANHPGFIFYLAYRSMDYW